MNNWEFNNNILKLYRNQKRSTSSTINLHGGTVTSWKVLNVEQLFIRDDSKFDNMNPIQGGIHVVFPNFNMDEINMPSNGFARYCTWEKNEESFIINNNIALQIELKENTVMKAVKWKDPFYINLNTILGLTTLTSIVTVHNPSPDKTISFNVVLETFLRLRSIENCQIYGLDGSFYIDKVNCNSGIEHQTPLIITEKFDRIYQSMRDEIIIHDLLEGRKIKVTKMNFPDIFIMSPWFGEHNQMICVAPGCISHVTELPPKSWYYGGQRLEILPLISDDQ